MHRDSVPKHRKLIQLQKSQKARIFLEGFTDENIILPLRVFEPVACGRMRCTQLRAVRMIAKNRRGQPDRETDRDTDT